MGSDAENSLNKVFPFLLLFLSHQPNMLKLGLKPQEEPLLGGTSSDQHQKDSLKDFLQMSGSDYFRQIE